MYQQARVRAGECGIERHDDGRDGGSDTRRKNTPKRLREYPGPEEKNIGKTSPAQSAFWPLNSLSSAPFASKWKTGLTSRFDAVLLSEGRAAPFSMPLSAIAYKCHAHL